MRLPDIFTAPTETTESRFSSSPVSSVSTTTKGTCPSGSPPSMTASLPSSPRKMEESPRMPRSGADETGAVLLDDQVLHPVDEAEGVLERLLLVAAELPRVDEVVDGVLPQDLLELVVDAQQREELEGAAQLVAE